MREAAELQATILSVLISMGGPYGCANYDRREKSILSRELKTDLAAIISVTTMDAFKAYRYNLIGMIALEAANVADREWMRKFMQKPPDHQNEAAQDHLSVVLGFTGMLSGGGNADDVARFATDHGWIDASGQLTAAGDQLARALLEQSGTRTVFRV